MACKFDARSGSPCRSVTLPGSCASASLSRRRAAGWCGPDRTDDRRPAGRLSAPMCQLNSWVLPSRTYQKSAVGMSSLAPVGWNTTVGVSNGPRKVPRINGSIATTQLPVNVGKQLAHPDDHIAESLTTVGLLARHTADAVEHTVLGEQIDEPLGVQDITLRQVVRVAHERFGVGCHCDLPSGYRTGRVQVHRRDGESSSPDSGHIPGVTLTGCVKETAR